MQTGLAAESAFNLLWDDILGRYFGTLSQGKNLFTDFSFQIFGLLRCSQGQNLGKLRSLASLYNILNIYLHSSNYQSMILEVNQLDLETWRLAKHLDLLKFLSTGFKNLTLKTYNYYMFVITSQNIVPEEKKRTLKIKPKQLQQL